jgi:hypothetical protein
MSFMRQNLNAIFSPPPFFQRFDNARFVDRDGLSSAHSSFCFNACHAAYATGQGEARQKMRFAVRVAFLGLSAHS